jgi:hypothetical protein
MTPRSLKSRDMKGVRIAQVSRRAYETHANFMCQQSVKGLTENRTLVNFQALPAEEQATSMVVPTDLRKKTQGETS